jgi:membrane protease YdiL (CAAX protease family)
VNPYPSALRRLLKVGVLAYPLLVWVLWVWSPLGFWGSAFLALLMELLPILGLAQLPLVEDEGEFPRLGVYLSSAAVILVLGWAGLVIGSRELGREAMGLGTGEPVGILLWALVVTVAIHLLQGVFFVGRRWLGIRESRILFQILPRTRREKAVFALLSMAAGIGEELAFRGFAVRALELVTGSLASGVLLSSAAFGLLHGYQGWIGIFRTGLMGLVLAVTFVLTGSLWPAILAHTALDLVSGLILGDTLLKER